MMRRCVALLALTGASVTACDVMTEPPMWEQTWVVEGETIELSVAELLPTGVGVNADTTAFVTEAPGASVTFSLADMCGSACTTFDGFVAPKPEFSDTITTTTSLPADLVSATLAGGSFDVTMAHDFNFDPLRPSSDTAAERGFIGITVRSGGSIVADTTISGEDQAFPAGTTLTPSMAIRPVEVSNTLAIEVRIYSPAGDTTTIESSDTLGVTLAPSTIGISEATVAATSITLDPTATTMTFGELEEGGVVIDRIQSGALRFRVQNPFAITGTMNVEFQLPGVTIQRTLNISQGSYSARVEFTGDELRQILASGEVDVVTSGTVTAPEGTLTVTPRQKLVLENDFELVLLIGGSTGEEG